MSKLLVAAVAVGAIAAFNLCSTTGPSATLFNRDGHSTRRNPRHCHQEG